MPLPLPNLDDGRWADLVEEGRALIPLFARVEPRWTDHNIHDPGITLMELFAWLTEMNIYRLNRVPDRHRRKFLALIGFSPQPPRAARTVLRFSLKAEAQPFDLPVGIECETPQPAGPDPRFRTLQAVTVLPLTIAAIQVDDGSGFHDQTRDFNEGLPFAALGENPKPDPEKSSPALYLGFREPLPPSVPITLFLRFAGQETGREERERIIQEATEAREACRRPLPMVECEEELPQEEACQENNGFPKTIGVVPEAVPEKQKPAEEPLPSHHSARTVWEVFARQGVPPTPTPGLASPTIEGDEAGYWVPAGEVEDDTRSLTLDGSVRITLLTDFFPHKSKQGVVPEALYYLRCRLICGQYDAPPRLLDVAPNSVMAEQAVPVGQWVLTIAAGVEPTGPTPKSGETTRVRLHLDDKGIVTHVAFAPEAAEPPEVTVLAYAEPTPDKEGQLVLELDVLGKGDGHPLQHFTLSEAPIQGGSFRLYTLEKKAAGEEKHVWHEWLWREDLDASARTDPHFVLNPIMGEVTFGTGEQGRVPPPGALIVAAYRATAASKGNVAAETITRLADTPHNRAVLHNFDTVKNRFDVTNRAPATGGQEAESLEQATGRAIETLWAHERLQDLCARSACQTLDQLPRHAVVALQAPQRAVSLLDFERLALDVPGTRVARARAWANLHPAYPCVKALGVVTVVILPYLPTGKPEPSQGLLAAVRRYLHRRRVVTTRVEVIGPTYLEVQVRAKVQALPGASPGRVREEIIQALNNFLNPLPSHPDTSGRPFGRDVYRSEILQVIDGVAGVDHVLSLELIPGDGEPQCGNLLVCSTWLVTPGTHEIEVVRG